MLRLVLECVYQRLQLCSVRCVYQHILFFVFKSPVTINSFQFAAVKSLMRTSFYVCRVVITRTRTAVVAGFYTRIQHRPFLINSVTAGLCNSLRSLTKAQCMFVSNLRRITLSFVCLFTRGFYSVVVTVLCSERVSQMTRAYHDIEAVTRLLEEVSIRGSSIPD